MKLKFIDTNNNLRSLILDETPQSIIKQNLKEGKALYGKYYSENLTDFANKFSELDYRRNCPEYDPDKFTKEEALLLTPNLLNQYEEYLDDIIPEDEKKYLFYFEWDSKAIYSLNNKSNNPRKHSSELKYVGARTIKDLAKVNHLLVIPDEGEEIEEGVEVISFLGKKKNFKNFFQSVADLLTESEKIYEGDKYTSFKASEVEDLKLEALEPRLKEAKDKIEQLESDLYDNEALIQENDNIIENPDSSSEDIELSKEDNEDLKADQDAIKKDISKASSEYNKLKKMVQKKLNNNEYDSDLVQEVFGKIDTAFEGHTYTVEEVERDYDAYGDGYVKASPYDIIGVPNLSVLEDSSRNWFGIKDTYFKFAFEKSKLIVDNKTYNYLDVNHALKKAYKDSKVEVSIEEWIKENPEVVKNIIGLLKPTNKKGENKMKNDALKNVTFKFADGTTIEVLESDGKDFATVKDEAIKVYKEFKSQAKDVDLIKENEKETEEVLEEYDAKATNDSAFAGEYLGSGNGYRVYKVTDYEQAHTFAIPKKSGRGWSITGSEYWGDKPTQGPAYWKSQLGRTKDNAFYFFMTAPIEDSYCVFINKNNDKLFCAQAKDDKETMQIPSDLPLEVAELEVYANKATNDSVEEEALVEETAYDSAKSAFAEGKTLKEWFAEKGKDLVDGDTDIAKKENAIEIWRSIKEEAEAEKPEETAKELSEDEQWDVAYKNMNYSDSNDTKIEDEVKEETEDKYEVIVGGKQIGIFATLEEAEEAEKKALEAIEKGIPKPTTEDCNM